MEGKRPRSVLIGFGNVGRELALLDDFWKLTRPVGVISSRGTVRIESEDDAARIREAAKGGMKLSELPSFRKGEGLEDFSGSISEGDVAFIALPPSYSTGEPNVSLVLDLLERGVAVITADKTPLALAFKKVMEASSEHRAFIGYRATVAAGTPFVDLARGLVGRSVTRLRSVLNATTNFLLSQVESGLSWRESIEIAGKMKLLEPDPSIDTEGIDAAAKLTIISNTLGFEIGLGDVRRRPLLEVSEEEVRRAAENGKRYKYVAELILPEKSASVFPMKLDAQDPLSSVHGNYNGIVVELEEGERIFLSGPAGPAWRTAKVMITDLLEYLRFYRPSH